MQVLIVTGMSGAGKTQAANALEDMGFYCVDNIPPSIIPSFVELSARGNNELGRLAIVTDVRGGEMFKELSGVLEDLKRKNVYYKILFLDASDDILIRRYKENRRQHPLCDRDNILLSDAVKREREILSPFRFMAHHVVDTSKISNSQLKQRLSDIFLGNTKSGIKILCKSFGFKHGTDTEADIVFDVRCLMNPFYIDELKNKTGIDSEVKDYIFGFEESVEMRKKIFDYIEFSLPLYVREGKSQLVIAFGCTGGKHRSVLFAEQTCRFVEQLGYNAITIHRDIYK